MKQHLIFVPAFGAALLLGACDQAPKYTADDLKAVDLEFSDYSKAHGYYEAFSTYMAEDAVGMSDGSQPFIGREAIVAPMEGGTGELLWYPVAADIAKSGDLGYTWGRYTYTGQNAEGETVVSHGKYITVWKLQGDGTWKAVLDGGNTNPPPPEE